jgi:hypothetical protein
LASWLILSAAVVPDGKWADWSNFYTSLKAVAFVKDQVIELRAGEGVRFTGATQPSCEKEGAGIEALDGTGDLFDEVPGKSECLNAEGSGKKAGGCERKLHLGNHSFFIAGYRGAKIKLVTGTLHQFPGDSCGK